MSSALFLMLCYRKLSCQIARISAFRDAMELIVGCRNKNELKNLF
jgi:hypothetical protein